MLALGVLSAAAVAVLSNWSLLENTVSRELPYHEFALPALVRVNQAVSKNTAFPTDFPTQPNACLADAANTMRERRRFQLEGSMGVLDSDSTELWVFESQFSERRAAVYCGVPRILSTWAPTKDGWRLTWVEM